MRLKRKIQIKTKSFLNQKKKIDCRPFRGMWRIRGVDGNFWVEQSYPVKDATPCRIKTEVATVSCLFPH